MELFFVVAVVFESSGLQGGENVAAGGNPEEEDEEAELWEQLRLAEQEAAAHAERRAARVRISVFLSNIFYFILLLLFLVGL